MKKLLDGSQGVWREQVDSYTLLSASIGQHMWAERRKFNLKFLKD